MLQLFQIMLSLASVAGSTLLYH